MMQAGEVVLLDVERDLMDRGNVSIDQLRTQHVHARRVGTQAG
jgi:hypothetical protein